MLCLRRVRLSLAVRTMSGDQTHAPQNSRRGVKAAGSLGVPPIRVLIVSDSTLLCIGLDVLMRQNHFVVAGHSNRFQDLLKRANSSDVDIIVVAPVKAPGSRLRAVEAAARRVRGVVVLLPPTAEKVHGNAIQLGNCRCLPNTAPPEDIVEAVQYLRAGRLTKSVSEQAVRGAGGRLTGRQQEVLELLAGGGSNDEIAGELGISGETVKVHLRQIYKKLHVANRAEAVALYLQAP